MTPENVKISISGTGIMEDVVEEVVEDEKIDKDLTDIGVTQIRCVESMTTIDLCIADI